MRKQRVVAVHTAQLAYWYTFSIPAIFIVLRIIVQRVIDGPPWLLKHFYIGVDLSLFSLSALTVNVIDQLRNQEYGFVEKILHTLLVILIVFIVSFYQVTVHQQWERPEAGSPGKTWMLCIVSNAIGTTFLVAFVLLKIRRLI